MGPCRVAFPEFRAEEVHTAILSIRSPSVGRTTSVGCVFSSSSGVAGRLALMFLEGHAVALRSASRAACVEVDCIPLLGGKRQGIHFSIASRSSATRSQTCWK